MSGGYIFIVFERHLEPLMCCMSREQHFPRGIGLGLRLQVPRGPQWKRLD